MDNESCFSFHIKNWCRFVWFNHIFHLNFAAKNSYTGKFGVFQTILLFDQILLFGRREYLEVVQFMILLPVVKETWRLPSSHPGMSVLAPNWVRLASNETNPGILFIRSDFSKFWLTEIWKSPWLILFGANLTHWLM